MVLLLEVVSLVEVVGVGEADDGDLLGVADCEVGMESFFEVERLAGLIFDGELEVEFDAENDLVDEGEVVVAEGAAGVGGTEGKGEMEVIVGDGRRRRGSSRRCGRSRARGRRYAGRRVMRCGLRTRER